MFWKHWWERLTGRSDADLDREIRAHLDGEADEQRVAGASASQARDAARRVFGSVTLAKEDTRATWRFAAVERLWHDAAYALRLMRRSPGFTAERFARIEMIPGVTGLSPLQQEFSLPLRILMITAGLGLLIACANVANLLLSRASARQREMAIRLALGGGRKRLIQQLLVESLLFAIIGGTVGLLLAWWSKKALVEFFMTQRAGFALDPALDRRVLMFTVGISLLTGILFGFAPALRATRLNPGETLKEQARSASGGRARQSLSQALIVLQVALSLLLLAGAGLFLRTLQNLRHMDLGFNPDHVLLMTIEPRLAGYKGERLAQLCSALLARFNATPGVRAVSAMRFGMINGGYSGRRMFLPGDAPGQGASADKDRSIAFNIVGPRFFETMGIALAGREFRESDTATSPKVAIVNERLARYYFGTDAVIGQRIGFDAKSPDEFEIIGVVHDTKYWRLRSESPVSAFVSVLQSGTLVGLERMTIAC